MPNRIPPTFGHIVRGPNGDWVEATPTQTPAPTRTISDTDRSLYGDAARSMRGDDGNIRWARFLELLLGGGSAYGRTHRDELYPSTPTPTPIVKAKKAKK